MTTHPPAAPDAEPEAPASATSDPSADALFNFPCDFPIKVMGKSHPEFTETILDLVASHDPLFDRSRVETRASGGGNYTGLTVNVMAQNRAHLDSIYLALTGHPMVKIVL